MARTVGSIEVTVNADTKGLVAQLKRAGELAGEAARKAIDDELADIGGTGLLRRLGELRQEIEAALDVDVEVGIQVPRRELAEAQAQLDTLRDQTVEVDVKVDTRAMTSQVVAAADSAGRGARRAFDRQFADIGGPGLRARLVEIRAQIEGSLRGIEANIGTTIDNTELRTKLAEYDAVIAAHDADVNVGMVMDASEVATQLAKLRTITSAGGGTAGTQAADAFSGAFSSGLGRAGGVLGGVVLNAIQPATVALEGAFGAAVAVVSSGMSALIGTVGALAPILAGVGATIGTLHIGLSDIGDALSGDADAFARLTPAAREFVDAFAGLRPVFDSIRDIVQENIFRGLGDALTAVARTILPDVGAGLSDIALRLNKFALMLADTIGDIDFAAIFEALGPIVNDLLRVVGKLTQTVEPFLLAAAPAAQQLAEFLADGAQALHGMVLSGEASGAISDFLTAGIDSLKEWVGLAGAVSDALITLFDAGRDAGDSFIASLAGIIRDFDDWMEGVAGQRALADFFADAREIIGDLVPLLKGAAGFFDRIVTDDAIDRFGDIAQIIGDLLPAFATFLDILGDISEPLLTVFKVGAEVVAAFAAAWEKIPDPLQDVFLAISTGTLGLRILFTVVDKVTDALGGLDTAAETAATGVKTLILAIPGAEHVIRGLWAGMHLLSDETDDNARAAKVWTPELIAMVDAAAALSDPLLGSAEDLEAFRKRQQQVISTTEQANDVMGSFGDAARRGIGRAKSAFEQIEDLPLDAAEAFRDLTVELEETFDVFSGIGRRAEGLQNVFDFGNRPRVVAGQIRDLATAISELPEAMEDIAITDIFGKDGALLAENIKADPFLDALDDIRGQMQSQIVDAFAGGGEQAARETAQRWQQTLTDQLRKQGFTDAQIAQLFPELSSIDVLLQPAVDQAKLAEAKAQIEALVAFGGETPMTLALSLALDHEQLSAEAAQAIANVPLLADGIPADLLPQVPPEALTEAQTFIDAHPGLFPVGFVVDPNAPLPTPPAIDPIPLSTELAPFDPGIQAVQALADTPVVVPIQTELSTERFDPVTGSPMPDIPPIVLDVDTTEVADARENVQGLGTDILDLPISQSTSFLTPGLDKALTDVGRLQTKVDALDGRTVRINVAVQQQRSLAIPPGVLGSMAGGIVTAPSLRMLGERGFPEAVVPLRLPLNRVDPSVRALAALLRGEGGSPAPSINKVVTVNQSFELSNADPQAVAVQALNRAAILAGR